MTGKSYLSPSTHTSFQAPIHHRDAQPFSHLIVHWTLFRRLYMLCVAGLGDTVSRLMDNKTCQTLVAAICGAAIGAFASFVVNCTLVEISINTFFAWVRSRQSSSKAIIFIAQALRLI